MVTEVKPVLQVSLGPWLECLHERDRPACLWVDGDARLLKDPGPCVAIVGARAATPYGIEVAGTLAAGLAQAGVLVVSGLALGIDTAAHHGALRAGGRTIAVLGNGVDVCYPSCNARLQSEMIPAAGAVISEFAPGIRPSPINFPRRNRIIAALARAVVIVEGGIKSGSLITARWGAALGKEVFAVPGSIFSKMSSGPHHLIGSGALPVTCCADILEALGLTAGKSKDMPRLSGSEAAVLALIKDAPGDFESLLARCGLGVDRLSAVLVGLEIKACIKEVSGQGYIVCQN
ncbi:MAG: DNA-processing protein DprA [Elusimicrobiota bacterium]